MRISLVLKISNFCFFLSSNFDTITFTPEDVYEELTKFDSSKASGPDLLKLLILLCISLTKLFTQSIESGSHPHNWVTANVVPVHKKG